MKPVTGEVVGRVGGQISAGAYDQVSGQVSLQVWWLMRRPVSARVGSTVRTQITRAL